MRETIPKEIKLVYKTKNYISITNVQIIEDRNIKKVNVTQAIVHICAIAKHCTPSKKLLRYNTRKCLTCLSCDDHLLSIVLKTDTCRSFAMEALRWMTMRVLVIQWPKYNYLHE